MPLANLTNNLTTRVVPVDVGKRISLAQVAIASGLMGNAESGAPATPVDLGIGRLDALLVLDLISLKVSAGSETYLFELLGSNDPTFAAGNCEQLLVRDYAAAAAGRLAPAYCGPSPVVPETGRSVRRHIIPFTNEMGGYLLRYAQLLLTVGGAAPSVTFNCWIADRESLAA